MYCPDIRALVPVQCRVLQVVEGKKKGPLDGALGAGPPAVQPMVQHLRTYIGLSGYEVTEDSIQELSESAGKLLGFKGDGLQAFTAGQVKLFHMLHARVSAVQGKGGEGGTPDAEQAAEVALNAITRDTVMFQSSGDRRKERGLPREVPRPTQELEPAGRKGGNMGDVGGRVSEVSGKGSVSG